MDLDDPFEMPDNMSGLLDMRREKIMKYKMPDDRKRSLRAGLMIKDVLGEHGISQEEIKYTDNGRPFIEGLDFNVSHSGEYVMLALSSSRVGCDIERIKERNYSVARRYFSDGEKQWLEESDNKELAFYSIWTAKESYIKLTGEGILLDFTKYEVCPVKAENEKMENSLPYDILNGKYLGAFTIKRENSLVNVIIRQWLYDDNYVVSICSEY